MTIDTQHPSKTELVVAGKSYACRVRYRSVTPLDRLAEFFHEEVLPREKSVSRLLQLYDLPSRLLEDILAELLRRNCAYLDLARGEIRRLDSPFPTPVYEMGGILRVWQDDVTGRVLPWATVEPFYARWLEKQKPKKDESDMVRALSHPATPPRGFLEASDGRMIDSLRSCDSLLFENLAPRLPVGRTAEELLDWEPVALVEKRPLDPKANLLVQIHEATIKGDEEKESKFVFVVEPALPMSLRRAWTAAFRGEAIPTPRTKMLAALAAVRGEDSRRSRLPRVLMVDDVDEWSGTAHLRLAYRPAVPRTDHVPDARGLQEIEEREGEIRSRLIRLLADAARSSLLLGDPDHLHHARRTNQHISPQDHLSALWSATKNFLLVMTNRTTEEFRDRLRDHIRRLRAGAGSARPSESPAQLIVVEQGEPSIHVDDDDFLAVGIGSFENVCPIVAIRDGVEIMFGDLDSLELKQRLVALHDAEIARFACDRLVALLDPVPHVRERLEMALSAPPPSSIRNPSEGANALMAEVEARLREFDELVERGIKAFEIRCQEAKIRSQESARRRSPTVVDEVDETDEETGFESPAAAQRRSMEDLLGLDECRAVLEGPRIHVDAARRRGIEGSSERADSALCLIRDLATQDGVELFVAAIALEATVMSSLLVCRRLPEFLAHPIEDLRNRMSESPMREFNVMFSGLTADASLPRGALERTRSAFGHRLGVRRTSLALPDMFIVRFDNEYSAIFLGCLESERPLVRVAADAAQFDRSIQDIWETAKEVV